MKGKIQNNSVVAMMIAVLFVFGFSGSTEAKITGLSVNGEGKLVIEYNDGEFSNTATLITTGEYNALQTVDQYPGDEDHGPGYAMKQLINVLSVKYSINSVRAWYIYREAYRCLGFEQVLPYTGTDPEYDVFGENPDFYKDRLKELVDHARNWGFIVNLTLYVSQDFHTTFRDRPGSGWTPWDTNPLNPDYNPLSPFEDREDVFKIDGPDPEEDSRKLTETYLQGL